MKYIKIDDDTLGIETIEHVTIADLTKQKEHLVAKKTDYCAMIDKNIAEVDALLEKAEELDIK